MPLPSSPRDTQIKESENAPDTESEMWWKGQAGAGNTVVSAPVPEVRNVVHYQLWEIRPSWLRSHLPQTAPPPTGPRMSQAYWSQAAVRMVSGKSLDKNP